MSRLHHTFAVEHAEKYGIESAILIHHFQFWIEQNQAMGRNFIDGRTWTFQTQKEISAIYPYMSEDVVFKTIKKLVDEDVLITANYNKSKLNKTQWYAFKNEKMFTKPSNDGIDSVNRRNASRQSTEYIRKDTNSTDAKKRRRAKPENVVGSSEKKPKSAPPQKKHFTPQTLDCLENLDITDDDRHYLCTHFEATTIEKAVAWATHPSTNIKTTLIKALMWACANPEKAIISQSPEETIKENKAYARETLTKAKIPSRVSVGLLNKYVEIYIQGAMQPDCINYDAPGFKKLLQAAMKKNKIE